MPVIFRKKMNAPLVNKPAVEDAYKAEVRLKLLKTRIDSLMALSEPVKLFDNGNSKLTREEALASQVFKSEFGATIGHRLGERVKINDSANEAWRKLLLRLKICERKYGFDHPWTQLVFEVVCNVAKKRAYYSVRDEDTKVEIASLPPEAFIPAWRREGASLSS